MKLTSEISNFTVMVINSNFYSGRQYIFLGRRPAVVTEVHYRYAYIISKTAGRVDRVLNKPCHFEPITIFYNNLVFSIYVLSRLWRSQVPGNSEQSWISSLVAPGLHSVMFHKLCTLTCPVMGRSEIQSEQTALSVSHMWPVLILLRTYHPTAYFCAISDDPAEWVETVLFTGEAQF
jgi:hypothetical protein